MNCLNIGIRGDGVAARTCGHLLCRAGLNVAVEAGARPRLPAVLIGGATQRLLTDILEREGLLEGLTRIRQRVVAWGDSEPRALEHDAVLLDEEMLLARIGLPAGACDLPSFDWRVLTVRRAADELPAGRRTARAIPVMMLDHADRNTCWIESLENGWLFLVPGWLLAVGDAELEQSRLLRPQIEAVVGAGTEFEAHPRIAWPLAGDGWLACGAGAVAFDPLCGDGCGNALREAILAAAVLRAVARGEPAGELQEHYSWRLAAAYRRHLEVAREFYRTGGTSPWWVEQVASIDAALEWCRRQLPTAMPARYRLQGFDLGRAGQPTTR